MFFIRLLFGLIFFLFIPGVAKALYWSLVNIFNHKETFWPVITGFVFGTVIWRIFLKRLRWFNTFEHELTHAIVALMFFRKIKKFEMTQNSGGHIVHVGTFGGTFGSEMIGLAPYFLPTFSLILVLILPLISRELYSWMVPIVGFTLAYHTFSTIDETDEIQPDLNSRGLLYSAIVINSMTLALHGLLFILLIHGYSGFGIWGSMVYDTTIDILGWLFAFIS